MNTRPYLGTNVSSASAEEVRQRGIIDADEPLLALFDGMLLDDNRRRIGGVSLSDFVVLTERRLITWARGFFNDTVDNFLWQDVDVAKAETWDPWHGRVVLAFRLTPNVPRTRRIAVKGNAAEQSDRERVVVNTLDYMPGEDVAPLANMIAWIGDQVVAGVRGETLVQSFTEQFPAPERKVLGTLFTPAPQEPPPPPPAPVAPPVEKPRRRWWQRAVDGSDDLPAINTGNLIADYESLRRSMPVGDGTPAQPATSVNSTIPPLMTEQPSMYEVSRTLRLFLEAPRRLARGVRRAGEMMSGAGELMSGMQDPFVRRNAMRGIYQAAAQQEAENGPLASVAPMVRAAVRFSEPLPSEEAEEQGQAPSRRIQVRSAIRRAPPSRLTQATQPQATPEAEPEPVAPVSTAPIRRSINVRRVEGVAEVVAPEP
ncbi:MAG: hypothetical protein HGA19_20085, partial [Oscillochloris sp.]|nr:hypothetical protein [Oscillochloris sp.]